MPFLEELLEKFNKKNFRLHLEIKDFREETVE